MAGVAVKVTVRLGQRDELRRAVKGVEDESAVLLGKAQVFCDLRGERCAVGLLFEQFRINAGWSSGVRVVPCLVRGMLLLPPMSSVEIDERYGNLFLRAIPFRADVMHEIADRAVAHNHLIAAVFEKEAGAMRSGGGFRDRHGFLHLPGSLSGRGGKDGQSGSDQKPEGGKLCGQMVRLIHMGRSRQFITPVL